MAVVGFGGAEQYDGDTFVSIGDVVLVTVNYRLGAFGWAYDLGFGTWISPQRGIMACLIWWTNGINL
eukprot:TRINITY_DN287_c0_g1_i2.p1 TRINITY_DN287_c0_g1~~TRINITY_DN287_c0_g1_i2.p1  ORF type:complete len:67 (+),score=15.05 TRINITY_DN287_c0_g1_i2:591-791(+)